MAKMVKRRTTTTVTEEIDIIPEPAGEQKEPHYFRLCGYGTYHEDGKELRPPHISLNGKWLVDAGFHVGDRIQVDVKENQLVIMKLAEA